MKSARIGQSFMIIMSVVTLATALSGAGLLVQLGQSDGLARYPQAERLAATRFTLDTPTRGLLSQSSMYETADKAARVLSWYAQTQRLEQGEASGEVGACRTFTRLEGWLAFRYGITVTLCARPTGTLIFVTRSLALR